MNISKSRYIEYKQCEKKLWLGRFRPELADEMDQTVFLIGNKVGKLARELFPGGTLVEYVAENRKNIEKMLRKTAELMNMETDVIYEAAFSKDNLLVICDILVKTNNGFDIYEVKSSARLKDVYFSDAAFQYYVLNSLGIKINNIYITHINNKYVRDRELNINKLFMSENITKKSITLQETIKNEIPGVFAVMNSEEEPVIDIGMHCNDPYLCQFKGYCFKHIPNNSVFNISKMHLKKKFKLYYNNVISFEDVRNINVGLTLKQQLQVDAQLDDVKFINKENIKNFLEELHYPLYFLDFETIAPPIPLFADSRPYQQIPTQYSLHYMEQKNGELMHKEFLAKEGEDPRYTLGKKLTEEIPPDACVLAYNMSFEKRIIRELAKMYDNLEESLMSIHGNIKDLMSPFEKKDYYLKEMRGRYSIKAVLPALFPANKDLSYKDLNGIQDGLEAANAYLLLTELNEDDRIRLREELLKYCRLDTLAMVRILEKLNVLI